MWVLTPIFSGPGRNRQEDQMFRMVLSYIEDSKTGLLHETLSPKHRQVEREGRRQAGRQDKEK